MPSVSLLVPMHNRARYIANLLAEAARQTESFDEIICFDDGSTDDCSRIAESHGARVLRGEVPRGPSHARNVLLAAAQSDFVHFHDDDDPLFPDFLRKMKPHAIAGANAVVISSFDEIRGDGRRTHHVFEASIASSPFDLVFKRYVHVNAMLIDRNLALQAGGFDESLTLCEEKDFLLKLLVHGARVQIVEETLAEWRRVGESSFMESQGWTGAAAMLRKFACNAAALLPAHTLPLLEDYVMRCSYQYYHADQRTLRELRLMFSELARKGIRPSRGLGWKAHLFSRIFGPTQMLVMRRLWSQIR